MATEKRSLTSLGSGSGQSGQVTQTDTSTPQMSDVEKIAPALGPPGAAVGGDEDLYKPKSVKFWVTILCNFLALFLVALDRTIIATAVPRITDEFNSLGDIGWYGSSYMLTTACAQLVFGRIYKFYDKKWTFFTSILVFEIGSAICGSATNSIVFILGRAIAGLGGAGIFSGTLLVLIDMVPLHKRPQFQGLFGMVFGLASVMGPLVGGGFTGGATWRWCFYINLPIGAVASVFLWWWWTPKTEDHPPAPFSQHVKRLDPIGILFLFPGIVCLFIALQWGGSNYDWNDWRIIVLFVFFGLCTIAYTTVQIKLPETATIPPRVITQRSVFFGTLYTFFLSGSMLMLVYYVPIWFQTVKQVDPIKSGIYTVPLVLSLVFSSIGSGFATQAIGYYVPSMIVAPILMSIGEGLLSTLTEDSPSSHWIAYQFLAGFGVGFGMQTSGLAVQAVLSKQDMPAGIAINFFVQQLGGAVFTSVGQTILSNILVSQLQDIPGIGGSRIIVTEGATHLIERVGPEYRSQVVDAYEFACRHIFLAALGVVLVALLMAFGMEWVSIKKKQGPGGPGGPGQAAGPPAQGANEGPVLSATATEKGTDALKRHSKSSSSGRDSISQQKPDEPKSEKDTAVIEGAVPTTKAAL
ncbi:Putative similar to aflatoxin efflux pump AFLT of neurospora crassa [Podospora comata]|uniref:Similar to aflatoxin efflux pump AFLT of neurospora crassa n=1 Tax=Podospora comata TaxID=48703 RepID=A0ABY6S5X8_PODCO|nr:Putative similar to aflatoxin efflux pump AFLT of neurospora crassa [Podospora comata]